jgi:hypothetical protein
MTERIFDRLYQAPEPSQASRKGLGLGLYICKELVTRQGGEISVRLQAPTGCIFSFSLPVFSLNNLIAPLIKNGEWPAESVALLVVQTVLPDAWPSKESQEAWSHEARTLLQRCLLPNLDVLLSEIDCDVEGERFFVAAFADDKGASVLARRIRGQFERLLHLKDTDMTVSVSHSMLQPVPRDVGASTERIVARMAERLEESMKYYTTSEAVSS